MAEEGGFVLMCDREQRLKPVSRLAVLRKEKKLTQLEIAKLLEITEATVANWERNRSDAKPIETVIKLCKIFDCTPEELIDYVPKPDLLEEVNDLATVDGEVP